MNRSNIVNVPGLSFALCSLLVGACATTPGARPEDMSAESHKALADKEKTLATDAQKKADKGEDVHVTQMVGRRDGGAPIRHSPWKDKAEMHAQHSKDHLAAAEALKNTAVQECAGLTDSHACSFEKGVVAVKKIDDGIETSFSANPPGDRKTLEQQARCHYAQGALVGRSGMPGCPLFNKALVISSQHAADGTFVIKVTSKDAQSVNGLHEWADVFNAK